MTLLRETRNYRAHAAKRGVRITAKERGVDRQSRVVSPATWLALTQMDDASFDGSCVLELGIGTWRRRRSRG